MITRLIRFFPGLARFGREERGSIILEFVLLAPVMSYLLMSNVFFHHHIDYAQDSTVRFRNLTWRRAMPQPNLGGGTGPAVSVSDMWGINPVNLTLVVQGAPLVSGYMGTDHLGGIHAADRYFNMSQWNAQGFRDTPYGTMKLEHRNFWTRQEQVAAIPENPYAPILGSMSGFWGGEGTGDVSIGGAGARPTGYDDNWEERFPMMLDPWQRNLNAAGDFSYADEKFRAPAIIAAQIPTSISLPSGFSPPDSTGGSIGGVPDVVDGPTVPDMDPPDFGMPGGLPVVFMFMHFMNILTWGRATTWSYFGLNIYKVDPFMDPYQGITEPPELFGGNETVNSTRENPLGQGDYDMETVM